LAAAGGLCETSRRQLNQSEPAERAAEEACAVATESVKEANAAATTPEKKAGGFEAWGKKWGLLLSLIVGTAIWLMPIANVNVTQHKMLAIFGGAVAVWVTMGVNFAVSIFIMICFLYFWVGNGTGAVKNGALVRSTDFVLSGFSAASLWLIVTGFVISIAMVRTGVARRLLLHVVRGIGKTPLRAIMAGSITTLLVSPFTPSNTARSLAMVPVVEGLAETYKVKAGESNFGKALALSQAFANNITGSAFLTATIPNTMFIAAIIAASGPSKYTSWAYWAMAAAPTNIILLLLMCWFLTKMYPPEMKEITGGIQRINADLIALGPITAPEKRAVTFFLLALILWSTDQLHHLNPTMIAFIISSLIFLPHPIGVLEWRDAQYSLPWELFVYVGGVTTMANCLAQTKAVDVIIKMAFASLGLKDVSYFWLLMLLIGFSIFSHVIWSTTTSMTGVMAPIYIGIAQSLGFDIARFCLPLAIMMAYALFLPFNTTGNLIFMQTGHYKSNDLLRAAIPIGIGIWLAWIITALTWWKWIGLM
jgi:anion transporter